jgi:rSAM/selenodomain-associated transferase 1
MFAKYWQPGKVKTRLACKIGAAPASQIYLALVRHLIERLCDAGNRRTIVYSPTDAVQHFRSLAGRAWALEPQCDGHLGRRLTRFYDDNLHGPDDKVIVVGSDVPEINAERIDQTARLLEMHPVVIGPSGDGGYYLIAMRGQRADIFDNIRWSTRHVLPATLSRLQELGIDYAMLPELHDIDELSDLVRLQNALLDNPHRDALDERLLREIQLPGDLLP